MKEPFKMTITRAHWIELMNDPEARLTQTELDGGYHWCPEWDDLLVGPVDGEWGDGINCICGATPDGKPSTSSSAD